MQRVSTVNGIKTHGEGSTDLLGDELRALGFEVTDVEQKITHTWHLFSKKRIARDVEAVLDQTKDGDIAVGHSYGCYKTIQAAKIRKYKAIYLFRPAMHVGYKFGDWWNPEDTPITCIAARSDWVIWMGGFVPLHIFGAAGARGFSDDRILHRFTDGKWKHSSDFHPKEQREYWAKLIREENPYETTTPNIINTSSIRLR